MAGMATSMRRSKGEGRQRFWAPNPALRNAPIITSSRSFKSNHWMVVLSTKKSPSCHRFQEGRWCTHRKSKRITYNLSAWAHAPLISQWIRNRIVPGKEDVCKSETIARSRRDKVAKILEVMSAWWVIRAPRWDMVARRAWQQSNRPTTLASKNNRGTLRHHPQLHPGTIIKFILVWWRNSRWPLES